MRWEKVQWIGKTVVQHNLGCLFYQNVEVRATISPTLALEDEKMEKNVTAAVSKHGGTQAY